jgi:hypothetical protein
MSMDSTYHPADQVAFSDGDLLHDGKGLHFDVGDGLSFDEPEPLILPTRADLENLERQIIPLLNTVRKLLGKRPVYVPKD